jgi:dihydrofolate reductase
LSVAARRRIRYQVACSLDGYIADAHDGFDWIPMDPDIDFGALFSEFDTAVMGRRTFELAGGTPQQGMKTVVVSRTLDPAAHPNVTVVADGIREAMDELRATPGKDIWLYGGGELFRTLLELDCVDTVELAVVPVVLGGGLPFLPAPAVRRRLKLVDHTVYPKSGIVLLRYNVMAAERNGAAVSA